VIALVLIAALAFIAPHLSETAHLGAVNLLLFCSIVAVVVLGYSGAESVLINTALVFFVLDVIARYFDFFWDMLPKSVFFMAGGLLLLAGGSLLERSRRRMMQEMKVRTHASP